LRSLVDSGEDIQ